LIHGYRQQKVPLGRTEQFPYFLALLLRFAQRFLITSVIILDRSAGVFVDHLWRANTLIAVLRSSADGGDLISRNNR
jgi:hypothetical protein